MHQRHITSLLPLFSVPLPVRHIGIALLLAAGFTNAVAAADRPAPKNIPELQTAIETVLKETRTPGVGIAIVSRDQVEWATGIGKADVAGNKPADADTLFRIGSVSKAFAALAALQLQEQGKLQLTDTVKQWVPEVAFENAWEKTDPVRLVHLMEHTTGFDDIHLREYALNDPNISLRDALTYGADSRVSRWRPGSRMSYCNSGPAILATVVEKVSGERFDDYVQKHLFNPIHMDTASYFCTPEVQQRLATLYHRNGVTPYPYWNLGLWPAGSVNASARDMAHYLQFYLQRGSVDGTQVVSAASIERMETPGSLPSAKLGMTSGYGLYNYTTLEGPFVFHGHSGGVSGGLTEMAYLPDAGRGYAFMINSGNFFALLRIGKVMRQYVTNNLTAPALPPSAGPVPDELQQHYSGYYQAVSPRVQLLYPIERLVNVRTMTFTSNQPFTTIYGIRRQAWVQTSDRLFRRSEESIASLALLPDEEGKIRIQLGTVTFERVSWLRFWSQSIGIVVITGIILSRILFGLVRGVLKLFGKLNNTIPWPIRRLPSLSILFLSGFYLLMGFGLLDVEMAGSRNFVTISILILSLAYPATTIAGVVALVRARTMKINRFAYWHAALVTIALAATVIYYGYWGWIGLRLWK
jgi:CubicO group peptidase (beta-lactamase class C family)